MINRSYACFIMLSLVAVLSSCSTTAKTIIEMDLTRDYDASAPFINEKFMYVSNDVDILVLNIVFQMKGDSSILEIADNETGQVYWSEEWNGNIDKTSFTVSLDNLEKEKEYVIRFTGTKIDHAKIVVTSENKLVKERERPLKPNKD